MRRGEPACPGKRGRGLTVYELRESVAGDAAAIARLYQAAFPDEDLGPLVRALLRDTPGVLSLVAVARPDVIGHAVLTPCALSDGADKVALLGPVAVAPTWQRQGLGRALVEAGLERQDAAAVVRVCVLGDPAYYRRLGFVPERAIEPPYPLPEAWRDAWQSRSLPRAPASPAGRLLVPPAWQDPALWSA